MTMVLIKCRYCCKPKGKWEQGTRFEIICCKVEQQGIA